jgi:hypothetical protein
VVMLMMLVVEHNVKALCPDINAGAPD